MSASGVSETIRHRVAVGDLLASWAARRPDRLCLAMDDREYTFAEMDEMADQVHAGMAREPPPEHSVPRDRRASPLD